MHRFTYTATEDQNPQSRMLFMGHNHKLILKENWPLTRCIRPTWESAKRSELFFGVITPWPKTMSSTQRSSDWFWHASQNRAFHCIQARPHFCPSPIDKHSHVCSLKSLLIWFKRTQTINWEITFRVTFHQMCPNLWKMYFDCYKLQISYLMNYTDFQYWDGKR